MIARPALSPFNIAGNTTETQQQMLQQLLSEAAASTSRSALEKLDRQAAQLVLESGHKIKDEFISCALEIIARFRVSDRYREEETASKRDYPTTYRTRPVEAQVTVLRKHFPQLGACMERVGRKQLPDGAEGWFAVPLWQRIAPSYNEAVAAVMAIVASQRKFANRLESKLGPSYLRQTDRAVHAEKVLSEQQPDSDIVVVAAQTGLLRRGCSARRARTVMKGNEFGLGAFTLGCILLTHPERLSTLESLMIDCCGDEYSLAGDGVFRRVPLYDYDLGGLQFSAFYDDRANGLWGSASGFLFCM